MVAERKMRFVPCSSFKTEAPSEPKVSAFSLSSIRAKRALEESNKAYVKEVVDLPTEAFQKQRC
jgi:hypothetical protein